ncbi:DUF6973 domain-containing protein [Microbacterium saperdae]|uniref:DUF6973 domain-containing protein n=1 Tax=Microbacterium saperdae TaxID=69368 RepID=A0A543BAM1_9MICO|nr:hypothetical protein [Microbacterium saperdae]TQL81852.1 hypothetical protein FB560_3332 [Microbacterium saperdae]GGM35277.1 hypothetical protein GCM10010489_02670 [Microbacterium saperdae]
MRVSRLVRSAAGVVAAAALVFTVVSPAAAADDDQQQLVEEVFASDVPLETFDALSYDEQSLVIDAVTRDGLPADVTEADVFVGESTSVQPFASGYNDLVMNVVEMLACVQFVDLVSCNIAKGNADTAAADAANRFSSTSLHNGKGDAYRHCYWNALMTRHIGANAAMKIAANHESLSSGPAKEKTMDTYNNAKGRTAGSNASSDSAARSTCYTWANNGTLRTLK